MAPILLGAAVILCFGALLCVNALLLRQNRKLSSTAASGNHTLVPPIGHEMPPLRGLTPSGQLLVVDYNQSPRPALLFVFSKICQICAATWPTWLHIFRSVDPSHFRVVFVNVGPALTAGDLQTLGISKFTLFGQLDPGELAAYNMQLTPEVIEVSTRGTIADAWLGALDQENLKRLESAIGVTGAVPYPAGP
jgi:hypothetical protein